MSPPPNPRAVICIWCAKSIILDTTILSTLQIYTIMKEHDLTCEYSPNVKKIIELKTEIKKLKGEWLMTKPNDENEICCSCSLTRIRWQELISCENPNSDHYKHILHLTHPVCKKYIPKEKREVHT